jgi:hypothetical protein
MVIDFSVALDPPGLGKQELDLLTVKDMRSLGLDVVAVVRQRTLAGKDSRGQPFKSYSTRAIYITKAGARLAPKGGRTTPSGKSVFYAEKLGYAQYKRASRGFSSSIKGATAEVDLWLSGQMMNSLHVSRATTTQVRVSLGAREALYGAHVNKVRRFMGLTRKERDLMAGDLEAIVEKRLAGAFGRGASGFAPRGAGTDFAPRSSGST